MSCGKPPARQSDEPRDGFALRRHAIGQVQRDFVDVAPTPAFGRVVSLDDGMAGRVEVPGGVAMR